MKTPSQNLIALIAIFLAVGLMGFLFAASRTDPSLRIAALVAGTGLVASLGSIASTLLTGKDVTGAANQAKDLPPNSTLSSTTTTTVAATVPPDPSTAPVQASNTVVPSSLIIPGGSK